MLRVNKNTIVERIRAKCELNEETGCEIYQGSKNQKGYGLIYYNGKMHSVHRIAYEVSGRTIPPGFDVHHICGERACCRIEHLRAIPHRLNVALTAENTALRWQRLQDLLNVNFELNFFGETLMTSRDLSLVWGKNFKGSNLSDYLETLKYIFDGDFKCEVSREGRGNRPHLYEIQMTPELVKRVESYEETNSLAALAEL
jgi:hypothetical protein